MFRKTECNARIPGTIEVIKYSRMEYSVYRLDQSGLDLTEGGLMRRAHRLVELSFDGDGSGFGLMMVID